jgi:hypothetical protein
MFPQLGHTQLPPGPSPKPPFLPAPPCCERPCPRPVPGPRPAGPVPSPRGIIYSSFGVFVYLRFSGRRRGPGSSGGEPNPAAGIGCCLCLFCAELLHAFLNVIESITEILRLLLKQFKFFFLRHRPSERGAIWSSGAKSPRRARPTGHARGVIPITPSVTATPPESTSAPPRASS